MVQTPAGVAPRAYGIALRLDPELRAYGVEGLRVADASVFPDNINGDMMAPTLAVAENSAGLIRGSPPGRLK